MLKKGNKAIRIFLIFLLAGAAIYGLTSTTLAQGALTVAGRRELVASLDILVRSAGPAGPLLFILVYTVFGLAIPATAIGAAGAFIFGKYPGFVYNFLGAVFTASAAFFISRYLFRDFAVRFLTGKLKNLDEKTGKHGFSIVFYLRLVFFPFLPLNYAAGIMRIRFRDYFLGTVLGIFPGTFIFSFFFGSLKQIIAFYAGPADLLRFDVLFPVGLFLFSFFIPKLISKLFPSVDA